MLTPCVLSSVIGAFSVIVKSSRRFVWSSTVNILVRVNRNFYIFSRTPSGDRDERYKLWETFQRGNCVKLKFVCHKKKSIKCYCLKKYLLSEDAPVGVVYVELPVEPVYLLGPVRGVVHQPGPVLVAQQALLGSRALTHEQACHTTII